MPLAVLERFQGTGLEEEAESRDDRDRGARRERHKEQWMQRPPQRQRETDPRDREERPEIAGRDKGLAQERYMTESITGKTELI